MTVKKIIVDENGAAAPFASVWSSRCIYLIILLWIGVQQGKQWSGFLFCMSFCSSLVTIRKKMRQRIGREGGRRPAFLPIVEGTLQLLTFSFSHSWLRFENCWKPVWLVICLFVNYWPFDVCVLDWGCIELFESRIYCRRKTLGACDMTMIECYENSTRTLESKYEDCSFMI